MSDEDEKEPEKYTREWFVWQGKKGGKFGAKAWEGLSDEARSKRAQRAVSKRKWHPVKKKRAPKKKST